MHQRTPSVAGGLLAPALVLLSVLGAGCGSADPPPPARPPGPPLFTPVPAERSGVTFANTLSEAPAPHRTELTYEYFANGGGVAVGDVDGDGRDDLYFAGNMRYNALYLNRGGLRFEDVTETAGVGGRRNTWKTGAAMADVNGDGLLDLYASYSGDLPLDRRVDELYINQGPGPDGVPRFEEQAEAYGLAHPHSSNQAYFFDADRDGDLDLFLLTHNVERTTQLDLAAQRAEDPVSGVRFYRNDGGRFQDVTQAAGFSSTALTYGLGAGLSDLDKDGWMDLYVGNDYSAPDYLYLNDGDGTFTDRLGEQLGQTSNASMGIDAADVDNDAWPDVVVLDMLAEDNRRQKTLVIPNDPELFTSLVDAGFHHQYMRNTLQLNNGDGTFSEVGRLAGIAATDWSWAPLVADLDNDGWKDLFVTNGILHDTIDRDFLAAKSTYVMNRRGNLTPDDIAYLMAQMPEVDLPNYAFRNAGGWQFENASAAWGLDAPLKSTGAAYADLDGDGDLDLVMNNLNGPASLFENHAAERTGHGFLQVELRGRDGNTAGIGAKVTVYAGGARQYAEQVPMRGYLSSVSPVLHFGLGSQPAVDSVRVVWPDGREQTRVDVAPNTRLTLDQQDAEAAGPDPAEPAEPIFEPVPPPIPFVHEMEGAESDFARQPLLVNAPSSVGPALAKADVDGDGLEDVFVGGGSGQPGALFLQQPGGQFRALPQPAFAAHAASHDADAAFFDADADGDPDLYIASGGYGTFAPDDPALQDRLYLGDGAGGFTLAPDALPPMPTSTGAVGVADVDGDGLEDVFVGGAVVPGRYPEPPRSYLLMNAGGGRFADRTAAVAPELQRPGMVRAAVWHDLDGDGADELLVAGLWMPIRVFGRSGDGSAPTLEEWTGRYFTEPTAGLWRTLLVDDLNGDGRPDLLAGNHGRNSLLRASPDEPAELHYGDFDADGEVDPLLTFYVQGTSYPFVTLDELRRQMPRVAARFPSYAAYADAQLHHVLNDRERAQAQTLQAQTLETTLFLGTEGGRFEPAPLPVEAQLAPVAAAHALDADGDGITDLLLGGNANDARIRLGKQDASYGVLLRGTSSSAFAYVPQRASGLSLRGDLRSLLRLGDTLLAGIYRAPLQAYRLADGYAEGIPLAHRSGGS